MSSALKTFLTFFLLTFFSLGLPAADLHYALFKKETGKGDTLLIIGGIHGNEPGGYFAPMLFLKHYKITYGNVWVVPNLNFDSLVRNRRGIYGDMNRKFNHIDPQDKDYQIVMDIKKLILSPRVDLVLNLHDGHGYYREKHIDGLFNPKAWGQACIIDQQSIPGVKFGNLQEIASKVSQGTNVLLQEDVQEFNVKNTETKKKDEAMRQSLTYFAIQNDKPAFAIETSKNISDLAVKVFYQLKTIEEFMHTMDIKYDRGFKLDVETIRALLQDFGTLEIPQGKITLELSDLRSRLNFFPIDKNGLTYHSDNPLVAVIKGKGYYQIQNGDIPVSQFFYDTYEFDDSLKQVAFKVDGVKKSVEMGSVISVKESFEIEPIEGYRVNVIGFTQKGKNSESGITIQRKEIEKRYSLDKSERMYRVEFYKGDAFCGMVVVKF